MVQGSPPYGVNSPVLTISHVVSSECFAALDVPRTITEGHEASQEMTCLFELLSALLVDGVGRPAVGSPPLFCFQSRGSDILHLFIYYFDSVPVSYALTSQERIDACILYP